MGVRKALPDRNYQMKITLKGVRPPIWRRVQVLGTIRLAEFHAVIQTVFGWTEHQFCIGGVSYGRPDDFDEDVVDEAKLSLAQAVGQSKRFTYTYDFGDNWEHEIVVEKILVGDSGSERPLCLASGTGRRRGGPWGYREFLKAIGDPRHAEHDAMLDWVGGEFDAEAFDAAAVNRALAALIARRWRVQ